MNTIVYHDSITLAMRARRPKPDETVTYKAIDEWDVDANEQFDNVINLATKPLTNDFLQ